MPQSNLRLAAAFICLGLAALTFIVFGQTLHAGFIDYDDDLYVYQNPRVTGALSWNAPGWFFTHADCSLYHPLTMLSLVADHQLYGLHPGGYHLTNVLLHTASVLLLFLVLYRMTGALWRSAFVAAVFAIHPLRAESVAWVSERKDVLSGFFFILTLLAYVHYARKTTSARYLLVVAAFIPALLSKPTAVTLPCVLLLLDYWPLQRAGPLKSLIIEKIPLLALSAAACVATALAAGATVASNEVHSPLSSRVANALVSYAVYLRQMVWPAGLAPFYPRPANGHPAWATVLSILVLVLITGNALAFGRKRRWLLVGWLWYLGMLAPMIGIVEAGPSAHMDRMTYLPQIGIYLMVAWFAAEWRLGRAVLGGLMAAVLLTLMICAGKQTAYWHDSGTLWTHALACTSGNDTAHFCLGNALNEKGDFDGAIVQYQDAIEIMPGNAKYHNNLGHALREKGRFADAISQYQIALQIYPGYADAHFNLANTFAQMGKFSDALTQYQQAVKFDPDLAEAQLNLGILLLKTGKTAEAITHFQQARNANPDNPIILRALAAAFAETGRVPDAINAMQTAIKAAQAENRQDLLEELQADLKRYQAITPSP